MINQNVPFLFFCVLFFVLNVCFQGRVVYANYGSAKDLADIKDKVDLKGSVLLLRAGQMSYAQKVNKI